MFRTTLAVVLSTLVVTASARAAEDVTPSSTLLASAATAVADRVNIDTPLVNPDLIRALQASAAPTSNFAAAPRRPGALTSMYAGLIALEAYDVYSTRAALSHGAMEANPMMQGIVKSTPAFVAVKVGMTAMTILGAERLWKNNHRTAAILVMAAQNATMAWVAQHNASVIGKLR